jgi:glutamine amidotransferase PdxT
VRNQRCTVAAFHPELTNDVRLHEIFVSSLKTSH